MKRLSIILVTFISSFELLAQNNSIPVFVSGTDGYKTYRIPAIVSLPNGDLLAFCEGRVGGSADFGNVDIVLKKSNDRGKTWSSLQKIVDNDSLQAGNPAPVIDLTDPQYPNGRIFLFYTTGNKNETEIRKGNGYKQVWYKTSTDGGRYWNDAVDITLQVHRPNLPLANPAYNFPQDWRTYATTPGHAIQFSNEKYKGRIYVAANHTAGNIQPGFSNGRAHGFYTDDHGKTFHLSDDIDVQGGNEATAAELSNGKLMINARNQLGNIKARIIAISNNGGQNWDTTYFDKNLPDPVCEGAILTIAIKKNKSILAFCNAADTSQRNNLTLRISYDEGKTWKKNILIDKSPSSDKSKDFTAYSDIVDLSKKRIGVLYERAGYSEITFTIVKW